ncbi:MAG: acetyl-CoA carboxylase biotin carboxyl carrier protein [Myxococcales bacterium]|nr:acetyl-CoA carboxylase biotin carboxyl carrier protein [Polyangiaceae bacterium]MDW8249437.1 acetyl-CoA carboxylase biotin carboxyl carrier protein [Myxococcales bacterium]
MKNDTPLAPLRIDRKTLRSLLSLLEQKGVTEFEYEDEHLKLRLCRDSRGAGPAPTALQTTTIPAETASPPPAEEDVFWVTSPFVGTFYRAPAPDAPPFCEVGSMVKPGQTLCIIEAMKLMNEIEADAAGVLLEVLVENGKAVEFGQRLFKLRRV